MNIKNYNIMEQKKEVSQIISLMKKYGKLFSQDEDKNILQSAIENILKQNFEDSGNHENRSNLQDKKEESQLQILKSMIDNNFHSDNVESIFGCPIEDISDFKLLEILKDRNSWELEDYVEEHTEENEESDESDSDEENDSDIIDNMLNTSLPRKMEDFTSDELYRFLCNQLGVAPNDTKKFRKKFKDFLIKLSKGLPDDKEINIMEQKNSSKNHKIIVE